MMANVVKSLDL